jgi:hypothetical protein
MTAWPRGIGAITLFVAGLEAAKACDGRLSPRRDERLACKVRA